MFKELLSKVASKLNERKIPYMIIGGQAVLLYGEPRLTRDIDITLGTGIEGLQDILNIVKDMGLKVLPENVHSFVEKTMVLPTLEQTSGIRIDFIFSFSPYEHQALRRAVKKRINNVYVAFASAEDVIIHKLFAGRSRDIEDVKGIILKNPDLDMNYIKKWLKEFTQSFPDRDFIGIFEEILNSLS